MLPKYPFARELQEANSTKSGRLQEDCEKQIEAMTKANTAKSGCVREGCKKRKLPQATMCRTAVKKSGGERILLKHLCHGPCEGRLQKLNTTKSDHGRR